MRCAPWLVAHSSAGLKYEQADVHPRGIGGRMCTPECGIVKREGRERRVWKALGAWTPPACAASCTSASSARTLDFVREACRALTRSLSCISSTMRESSGLICLQHARNAGSVRPLDQARIGGAWTAALADDA